MPNADTLFSIVNLFAFIAWIFLMGFPKWSWTRRIVLSGGVVLVLACLYSILLFSSLLGQGGMDMMSFSTLEGVTSLFGVKEAVLVGWVHYLAFDLFAGMWEAQDAKKHNIPHILLVPCLLFTFMFGPFGLLLYFIIRWAYTKQFFKPLY